MSSSEPIFDPAFAPVKSLLEQQIADGLHPGAQLCVQLSGEIVADFAVGEAAVGTGTPLTADSVMPFFSSAKPISAVAIGVLVDSGRLGFGDSVATHIPEFGVNGKSEILVRHLMNHTSGLANDARAGGGVTLAEAVAGVCASEPIADWIPGKRAAYSPVVGWLILGEVIERVSGLVFESFVQQHVLDPLGMADTYPVVGVELAEKLGSGRGVMHNTRRQPMFVDPAYAPERLGRYVRPGSSFHGPAHDLVKLYSMLLGKGVAASGVRVISSSVVGAMTTRQDDGLLDETFGNVIDRGLGFYIDSKRHSPAVPYGYGRAASATTFGHGGKESSAGFADPEKNLAVSLIFNGMPGEPKHDRRQKQVLAAVYEAVGAG